MTPVLLEGDWLLVNMGDEATAAVPFDAYLHEVADANPEDGEAMRALVQAVGPLTPLGGSRFTDLPCNDDQGTVLLAEEASRAGRSLWDYEAEKSKAYEASKLKAGGLWWPVHVSEVSVRVRILQQLTRHAIAHAAGESVAPVWHETAPRSVESFRGIAELANWPAGWESHVAEQAAWRAFTDWTNAALQVFHVRAYVDFGSAESNIGDVYPNAYQVCVLQIINHLAVGTTYGRCASDTCGRAFVRQRGLSDRKAQHYSRTEGVRYCSRGCANAQTQRDYRRNRKLTKGE